MKRKVRMPGDGERHPGLHKRINWNIGTVIFAALFFYMFISLILYLTADHITSYQVTAGPLSKNETCTAIAIREERVVDATTSGYVSYFARDYSKVRKDGIVYGIGSSRQSTATRELTEGDLNTLRTDISKFVRFYSGNNFGSVYDFKYSLGNSLLDYSGLTAKDPDGGTSASGGMLLSSTDTDGIVVYSVDGMEGLTEESVTAETFQKKDYHRKNLKGDDQVDAGDPVYKLVTGDEWSILFPVTDKQLVRLESRKKLKVKFLKDGESETGSLALLTQGDQRYAKVTFSSGMIRYADERYLDVELVTNTKSGLKIPVTSIVRKDFYTVPESLWTKNDKNTAGFRREVVDKDGKVTTEFINATIYARLKEENSQEAICYLDTDTLKEGDVLVNPEKNLRYTVGEKSSLEGVYCINKGYAVFRMISIIDQNEEYCIVDSGTSYGIAQFDYIALDGSTVSEKEVTI